MRLYDIDHRIDEATEAACDPETGEILPGADRDLIEHLGMEREAAIEDIGLYIKDLRGDRRKLAEEKFEIQEGLQRKIDQIDRKIDYLEGCLQRSLRGEKFKTARVSISYHTSEYVDVHVPVDLIPPTLLRYKDPPAPEPDKPKIRKLLKQGITVEGCELVRTQTMQIK